MNIRLKSVHALFLIVLLYAGGLSAQETRYVTDRLNLGLFEKEKGTGKRIETLSSGATLVVLDKQRNFTKVRTAEGNIGWVKSAYLIGDKPAVVKMAELESEYKRLSRELDEYKTSGTQAPNQSNLKIQALEKELQNKDKVLKDAQIKIEKLVNRSSSPSSPSPKGIERVKAFELSFSGYKLIWYVVGIVMVFVSGLLLGVHISNNRIRRRLYGFTLA